MRATLRGHTDTVLAIAQLNRPAGGAWDARGIGAEGVGNALHTLGTAGETLVTCASDNTVKLWYEAQCIGTLRAHSAWVSAIAQLCDGRLVTGSFDETIKVWSSSHVAKLALEAELAEAEAEMETLKKKKKKGKKKKGQTTPKTKTKKNMSPKKGGGGGKKTAEAGGKKKGKEEIIVVPDEEGPSTGMLIFITLIVRRSLLFFLSFLFVSLSAPLDAFHLRSLDSVTAIVKQHAWSLRAAARSIALLNVATRAYRKGNAELTAANEARDEAQRNIVASEHHEEATLNLLRDITAVRVPGSDAVVEGSFPAIKRTPSSISPVPLTAYVTLSVAFLSHI